ncbi:MAG TPA: c-type cytochrome biogenesis protein CcmI [Burkholderiaceae bacterium]
MTVFLLFAALMLAAALFFVLPPLLQKERGETYAQHAQRAAINLDILRDQLRELDADRDAGSIDAAGYDAAKRELEQRVAEEVRPETQAAAAARKPWAAIAVSVLLPVAAGALYYALGTPQGLNPANTAPQSAQQYTPEQISAMVDKLASEMKDHPDDIKGWTMLARSYARLGRLNEATAAYAHLAQLMPHNAELLSEYAEVLGSGKQSLIGEPEKLIDQALAADPQSVSALAMSGAVNFERHNYQGAVTQWRKILALVPPNSEVAQAVTTRIDEALNLSGMPAQGGGSGVASSTVSSATSNAKPASLSGTVDIDPALRAQANAGDTVFVYARALSGPPMPLAVLRKQVRDLPISFTLDDSMSMMPGAKLSGFADVVVGARISKSGNPMPAAGDLEGLSATVHPGAKGLKILIDSVHK